MLFYCNFFKEFMDIIVDETEIIPYEIYRRYISGNRNCSK